MDNSEFIWDGKVVDTHADVAAAVREIVRLAQSIGEDNLELMPMEFLDAYGAYLDTLDLDPDDDGRTVARDNIGYLAGYEDVETRRLIFKLFECEHPVMGKQIDPTPEEAFEAGKRWAVLERRACRLENRSVSTSMIG